MKDFVPWIQSPDDTEPVFILLWVLALSLGILEVALAI